MRLISNADTTRVLAKSMIVVQLLFDGTTQLHGENPPERIRQNPESAPKTLRSQNTLIRENP